MCGSNPERSFEIGDTVLLKYQEYENWYLENVSEHGSAFHDKAIYVIHDLRYPIGIPYVGIQERGGVVGGYVPAQFLVHVNQ